VVGQGTWRHDTAKHAASTECARSVAWQRATADRGGDGRREPGAVAPTTQPAPSLTPFGSGAYGSSAAIARRDGEQLPCARTRLHVWVGAAGAAHPMDKKKRPLGKVATRGRSPRCHSPNTLSCRRLSATRAVTSILSRVPQWVVKARSGG